MKIAISVPDELFEAADGVSKRLGLSRSAFYARAVESYLKTVTADEVREGLDAVYGQEPSGLDPVLDQLQSEALREEW